MPTGASRVLKSGLGIGVVGYGRAARTWHVPAYLARGMRVVGAHDISSDALREMARKYPDLRAFETLDALLEDSAIDVIDLATRPPGRIDLLERILNAGKHVLVQKPVSADVEGVRRIVQLSDAQGLRVAVNVNGRWAPAWAAATSLLREGRIGAIQSITHVFDTRLSWVPNPQIQGTDHFLLFDYATHWIDITQHWVRELDIECVQARDRAAPVQACDGQRLETMWIAIDFCKGPSAVIRGAAAGTTRRGHPFWVHGTEGTVRGDIDSSCGDRLEVEIGGRTETIKLAGNWFPDGFGAAMGELMQAVIENRAPTNSLRDHLRTVATACAACDSARAGGAPIRGPFDGRERI
jgi:predicted dehydrogenase